jgi:8-hydroxy-5-deazaflavin:NADPH oxidoreductase
MNIGLIGGTGREGRGLALRWARAGHAVRIGSRDAARAKEKADELRAAAGAGVTIEGGDNAWAASADVALLSVPYSAHAQTLESVRASLDGRILIDITVPLKPPKVGEVNLPAGQSAALEAQALHHVSSAHLGDPDHALECDVLVCGDDAGAREKVIALIEQLGAVALDAGPLKNAVALESLTPVLLHLNKRYKTAAVGVRFTNVTK